MRKVILYFHSHFQFYSIHRFAPFLISIISSAFTRVQQRQGAAGSLGRSLHAIRARAERVTKEPARHALIQRGGLSSLFERVAARLRRSRAHLQTRLIPQNAHTLPRCMLARCYSYALLKK